MWGAKEMQSVVQILWEQDEHVPKKIHLCHQKFSCRTNINTIPVKRPPLYPRDGLL